MFFFVDYRFVGLIQITVRPCLVSHQHRLSVVLLAGSFILARTQTAPGCSTQQHRNNVLKHVLMTPAVTAFLLICTIAKTCDVTYTTTKILLAIEIIPQHCLKSSESAMLNQVRDVIDFVHSFTVNLKINYIF